MLRDLVLTAVVLLVALVAGWMAYGRPGRARRASGPHRLTDDQQQQIRLAMPARRRAPIDRRSS